MQRTHRIDRVPSRVSSGKLILLGCMAALVVWLVTVSPAAKNSGEAPSEVGVPDVGNVGQSGPQQIPRAVPTYEVQVPPLEELRPTPTEAPTLVPLGAPTVLTPLTVTLATLDQSTVLVEKDKIDSVDPIYSMTWAPTGDKFLYLTASGGLYWSNTDGSNATLLTSYDPDRKSGILDDQMPKGNTLLVPGYALRFTVGQPPAMLSAPDTVGVYQIRWWSATRASGIKSGSYDGGEKLVTLDADGKLVEERNIPYMLSGAVRPGGGWLAYSIDINRGYSPPDDPGAIYLMNLATGQRYKIAASRQGEYVRNWSPDGNWFLMSAIANNTMQGVLVTANGQEWFLTGYGVGDAVWSSDSRKLALSVLVGGQAEPNVPGNPLSSNVYILDIPQRKVSPLDQGSGTLGSEAGEVGSMMKPAWSPSGSSLVFLALAPEGGCTLGVNCCPCTSITPALYLMTP